MVGILRFASVETAGIAAPLLLLDVVVVAARSGAPAPRCWPRHPPPPLFVLLPAAAGFGIEDPDDWVAFVTFTVTAIVAGELASRAERRTAEAQQRPREIERLYQELHAAFERASEAEAARRNEQLKAALLDALTHNLRTPLTAIKAAVTALIGAGAWTPISELSSEGRRELLQVIDEESDRLNRFIEGLSSADRRTRRSRRRCAASGVDDIVRAAVARAENLTRDHRVISRCSTSRCRWLSVDAAVDHRSDLHPARQRQQVLAGRDDDSSRARRRRRALRRG